MLWPDEGMSVVVERFIRTLKAKVHKKMTVNEYYLGSLSNIAGEYNSPYSIGKKPIDLYYSALTEEFELSHKVPKFKVGDRV